MTGSSTCNPVERGLGLRGKQTVGTELNWAMCFLPLCPSFLTTTVCRDSPSLECVLSEINTCKQYVTSSSVAGSGGAGGIFTLSAEKEKKHRFVVLASKLV